MSSEEESKDVDGLFEEDEERQEELNGRWKRDEHERFIEGLRVLGKNWSLIHKLVGTRSSA